MFLGIDQGTTGTTALLLSKKGKVIGTLTVAVPQHFPQPGWVEHDPNELWKSVQKAVTGLLRKTKVSAKKILGVGITNQRETVTLFDDSKALHRFIVWQDRRTSDICKSLEPLASLVESRAGLPIDPYFSASKILWLKRKLNLSSRGSLSSIRFRTVESFLLEKLTGVDATELTNASRTSLLNLHSLRWDHDLCSAFEVPLAWCPPLIPSEGYDFKTKDVGFLPEGIPVVAALGDQQAALFGQCAWNRGEGKITFGTGSFILLNVGPEPARDSQGLVSTLALARASGERTFALEGSVFNCGSWLDWLANELVLFKNSKDSEALAKQCRSSSGVLIVPALTGLGAPFWKPQARAMISGISRGSGRAEIARASLEALAFQNKALIDAMMKAGFGGTLPSTQWKVDGGVVRNNLLMQIQADLLGTPLVRPKNLEATALGVASLAALSLGAFSLSDLKSHWKAEKVFEPHDSARQPLLDHFQDWFKLAKS